MALKPLRPALNSGGKPIHVVRPRKMLYVAIGLMALLILTFLFGGNSLWGTLKYRHKTANIKTEIDSLIQVNDEMRKRIALLKSDDPFTLEEEARSNSMVRKGEKVVMLKSKP